MKKENQNLTSEKQVSIFDRTIGEITHHAPQKKEVIDALKGVTQKTSLKQLLSFLIRNEPSYSQEYRAYLSNSLLSSRRKKCAS